MSLMQFLDATSVEFAKPSIFVQIPGQSPSYERAPIAPNDVLLLCDLLYFCSNYVCRALGRPYVPGNRSFLICSPVTNPVIIPNTARHVVPRVDTLSPLMMPCLPDVEAGTSAQQVASQPNGSSDTEFRSQSADWPSLELPTAASLLSGQLRRRESLSGLSDDLARAAVTRHCPLWGIEEVSNAFAAAMADEDSSPADTTEGNIVMNLLEQTSARLPDSALMDLVYRKLCKRTIERRSVRAAACASRLAFKLVPANQAASRLRVLVFDVAYNFGNTAPDVVVRLVAGVLRGLPSENAVVFGRDHEQVDPLQAAVRHTLQVCLENADISAEFDGDTARCLRIFQNSEVSTSEASIGMAGNPLSLWSAVALKAAMDSDNADFAFNGTLALALEARMAGPIAAYDVMLREHIWPCVSALSDLDTENVSTETRNISLIRRGVRALHVIGYILAALAGNTCTYEAWSSIETRLLKLMECTDLSLQVRSAAAEAMNIKKRGIRFGCS
jgi:hypothetical protein